MKCPEYNFAAWFLTSGTLTWCFQFFVRKFVLTEEKEYVEISVT